MHDLLEWTSSKHINKSFPSSDFLNWRHHKRKTRQMINHFNTVLTSQQMTEDFMRIKALRALPMLHYIDIIAAMSREKKYIYCAWCFYCDLIDYKNEISMIINQWIIPARNQNYCNIDIILALNWMGFSHDWSASTIVGSTHKNKNENSQMNRSDCFNVDWVEHIKI